MALGAAAGGALGAVGVVKPKILASDSKLNVGNPHSNQSSLRTITPISGRLVRIWRELFSFRACVCVRACVRVCVFESLSLSVHVTYSHPSRHKMGVSGLGVSAQ